MQHMHLHGSANHRVTFCYTLSRQIDVTTQCHSTQTPQQRSASERGTARLFTRTVMSSQCDESKTLWNLLEEDLDEAVDYKSVTDFAGFNKSSFATITGEDGSRRQPKPFPDRGANDMLTTLCRTAS